jgi:hypothetical protein
MRKRQISMPIWQISVLIVKELGAHYERFFTEVFTVQDLGDFGGKSEWDNVLAGWLSRKSALQ